MQLKNTLLIALGTGALLLIPLLFRWPWTLSDFVIGGALIFVVGSVLDLIWRRAGKRRLIVGGIVVFLFLWLWAELAVGVFTNWGS
jgi:hypothetical protein